MVSTTKVRFLPLTSVSKLPLRLSMAKITSEDSRTMSSQQSSKISEMLAISTMLSKSRLLWDIIQSQALRPHINAINLNFRFQGIEVKERSALLDLPTVGYQGHQSLYKKPVTGIEHRKDPFFNVNPMRPRLKDRDVRSNEEFATLSAGMQIAMHSTKQREA